MNPLAAALAPVHRQYLLNAGQMQAPSFSVHIPLVCFAIAFPAVVMFVDWLGRFICGGPLRALASQA